MHIKKGDNVIVITGKEKGNKGKVIKVLRDADKVIVDGLNKKKRHMRPRKSGQKGQIIEMSAPIHVSNVKLATAKTNTKQGITVSGEKKTTKK